MTADVACSARHQDRQGKTSNDSRPEFFYAGISFLDCPKQMGLYTQLPSLRPNQSYPIQDEPEGEAGFQYKMSLERMASWRIDNQRARSREIEPGSDPGFSTS